MNIEKVQINIYDDNNYITSNYVQTHLE